MSKPRYKPTKFQKYLHNLYETKTQEEIYPMYLEVEELIQQYIADCIYEGVNDQFDWTHIENVSPFLKELGSSTSLFQYSIQREANEYLEVCEEGSKVEYMGIQFHPDSLLEIGVVERNLGNTLLLVKFPNREHVVSLVPGEVRLVRKI